MNRIAGRVVLVLIGVIITQSTPAQDIWQPPTAPDLIVGAPIEYLTRAVVRVKSTWYESGEVIHQELGTGLFLGLRRSRAYVVTAEHVVRSEIYGSADSIEVTLKRAPHFPYYAEVVRFDHARDIAVVMTNWISNDPDRESLIKLPIEYDYPSVEDRELKVIGHAGGYPWSVVETRSLASTNPSMLRMERVNIDSGDSGGPVLSEGHRLIGMVVAVEGDDAYALRIEEIVDLLETWDISYRPRFFSDISTAMAAIKLATYNHDIESLSERRYEDVISRSTGRPIELYRPSVSLFNQEVAVFVKEYFDCGSDRLIERIETRSYYVELIGRYYDANTDALDEAWRILTRIIYNYVPAGWYVHEEGYSIDFYNFKALEGRKHIRIEESYQELYVIIGLNLECYPYTGIEANLDFNVNKFLSDKWVSLQE